MLNLWLAWRYLIQRRSLMALTGTFAFVGIVIGVASLVVAMAVVSGYDTTLKRAVIDVTGDVLLVKRGQHNLTWQELYSQAKEAAPEIVAGTRFLFIEGVLAKEGKLNYVVIQGIDPETSGNVLNLSQRVIAGKFTLKANTFEDEPSPALLGKGIVKKFNLKLGDSFQVVHPVADDTTPFSFTKRIKTFQLVGILDLGKFEYDERYIVTHISEAEKLAGVHDRFTGLYLRLNDSNLARTAAYKIREKWGSSYWARDWQEVNENLFQAIKIEKVTIFFVILILVIASAFNISSTLFINVICNFAEISVLKAIGATRRTIMLIFTLQGLLIGLLGSVLGILLGWGLCACFSWGLKNWNLMPPEIYRLDMIQTELRFSDLLATVLVTLLICVISTLAPAFKGAKLNIVEGLRYE